MFLNNYFSFFLLLVLVINHITALFYLRALCYATSRIPTPYISQEIYYEYNIFSLSQGGSTTD
jgi:hypothetical protein